MIPARSPLALPGRARVRPAIHGLTQAAFFMWYHHSSMDGIPTIEVVDRNSIKLIRVRGNINTDNSADFRDKLLAVIEQGCAQIALDVEHMNYINSMGIGAMVDAYNRVKQAEGAVALIKPSKELAQLLKILRLDKLFRFVGNYDEALEFFLKRKLL